jgi:hypothetical protein
VREEKKTITMSKCPKKSKKKCFHFRKSWRKIKKALKGENSEFQVDHSYFCNGTSKFKKLRKNKNCTGCFEARSEKMFQRWSSEDLAEIRDLHCKKSEKFTMRVPSIGKIFRFQFEYNLPVKNAVFNEWSSLVSVAAFRRRANLKHFSATLPRDQRLAIRPRQAIHHTQCNATKLKADCK